MANIASDPITFMQECRRDALYTATKQIMVKYFRAKIKAKELDEQVWQIGDFKEMLSYLEKAQSEHIPLDTKKWLITISPNPKSEVSWVMLIKTFEKLCGYKGILHEPTMVLEQRSEDVNNPYGYHMHIATANSNGLCASALITRCQQAVKNTLGIIDRTVVDVKWRQNAYEYVAGEKSPDKEKKMEVDRLLRKDKNLEDLYIYKSKVEKV